MKTAISLAAMLLGVAAFAAAESSLVGGMDFNTDPGTTTHGAVLDDSLNIGTSTTATVNAYVSSNKTGSYSFAYSSENKVGSAGGCSYVNVSDTARPQFNNLGLSTETGFTIAINARLTEDLVYNTDKEYLFLFEESGVSGMVKNCGAYFYKKTKGGANVLGIGSGLSSGLFGATTPTYFEVELDTWYSIFLTVEGTSVTLTALNVAGEVVGEAARTWTTATVQSVLQGYSTENNTSPKTLVDNFGVYDGVLTTDEMKAVTLYEVANSTMPTTSNPGAAPTPEPTTSALSLLALAALAARRRRK